MTKFTLGILFTLLVSSCAVAPAMATSSLVATINYKLSKWVHPTGKCANEQLATQYGNGDGFVGKKMSNGGRLDRHTLTVAHRSLPFGTRVNFTNPHNGKSVTATVTDRGPFTRAKFDMGPAAANALGMHGRISSTYLCVN